MHEKEATSNSRLVLWALRNPYLVIVAILLCALLGVTALSRLPADILPVFRTPAVQIVTFYPGMPAEVMEKDITSRLERWTGQANGIAKQEARSLIGVSIVKDYFRDDIDPNTAMSQVSTLAASDLYYLPPGTSPPMVMPFDPTAAMPLCLLTVHGEGFDEKRLYDIAYFDLRNRLQGVPGVIAPAVYGGKLRRILAYVDPDKLQARGLSPMDVVQAVQRQNTMIPTGNAKFGGTDYQLNTNGMVEQVENLDDIPIRGDGGSIVYLRDVAKAKDSAAIQTNIVRVNGRRQVYIPIYRQPGANTIEIVKSLNAMLPPILERLPKGIKIEVAFDQSVFVKKAISTLAAEALGGGVLAILMILIFLASVRATLIAALAIPVSLLFAFLGLYFSSNTINLMTLGGLTLVMGCLVDNTIVVIENTRRHLGLGKTPRQAAADAAGEVAMPVLAATLTTATVFLPVIFLSGIGRFLFTPLALAVAFAIAASYFVAMTLVPICCARFFRAETAPSAAPPTEPLAARWLRFIDLRLDALTHLLVGAALRRPAVTVAAVILLVAAAATLYPLLGRELFPPSDVGQFTVRVRAPSGTSIEETEKLVAGVETEIKERVGEDLALQISNSGILLDWPAAYTPNAGTADAFVLVELKEKRRRGYLELIRDLRPRLRQAFPGVEFAFETGGILTAALNGGLPSPINIQIEGNKLDTAKDLAQQVQQLAEGIPGAVDVRIQQKNDWPQIAVDVDRTRSALLGLDQQQVVKNVVTAFNSSVNFSPSFWIDPNNGNHYFIGAQYGEDRIRDLASLAGIPVSTSPGQVNIPLGNLAAFRRTTAPAEISHLNIGRVTDVFVNVEGRDVGSVARDLDAQLAGLRLKMQAANQEAKAAGRPPPYEGYKITQRGEVAAMQESFGSMAFGLALAAALVYLILIAQFRSFVDPLLVMSAVPLGLSGVLLTLWSTGTALSIQSLIGVVFMIGICVSNSVLLVEFANRLRREQGLSATAAALAGARTRLRPMLMTSLATGLGMLPMAIGFGHGSEAGAPLARAVVGGLAASFLLTLFLVPALFAILKSKSPSPAEST